MASVRLDAMLREFTPKLRLTVEAGSVRELIESLEAQFPRLRGRLRDETGQVRRFVRVFVNGEPLERSAALSAPLAPQDSVDILHSIQGG
jgi:sulfur-carrier protein